MKKLITGREILLLSGSRFFNRDLYEKENNGYSKKLSQKEMLIQFCWNGILNEMIPEIFEPLAGQKPLTLWEINEMEKLLYLRYGDPVEMIIDEWSIHPYVVSEMAVMN